MSYIDNEILERLIGTMVEGFARIEKKLDQMNRLKECMNGDKLLDNVDGSGRTLWCVTKNSGTLQARGQD